jgi:hypothetical protein
MGIVELQIPPLDLLKALDRDAQKNKRTNERRAKGPL